MKNFFGILLVTSLIFSPCTFAFDTSDENLDIIKLYLGEVERISVSIPSRVVIGNPNIADVTTVTEREIVISPKAQGTTSFVYWDLYGQHSYTIQVYAENINLLEKRIGRILKDTGFDKINLNVNEDEAKIFLSGVVGTNQDKEKLNRVLDPLKDKLVNLVEVKEEKTSVEMDVQILELTKTDVKTLGVDWFTSLQLREEPYVAATGGAGGVATTLAKIGRWSQLVGVQNTMPGKFQMSRDALTLRINTLITEGKGKVLSRPKLTCLSGKEAEFLVGGEVPIVSASTTGSTTSTSVTYKKYGITLKIKPQVVDNQGIKTVLTTEVSAVDYSRGITVAGTATPEFTNRSASTELYLQEGETLFLAGLITNNESNSIGKFPVFGEVPILSILFKSKRFRAGDTELVICITPKIIREKSNQEISPLTKTKELVYKENVSVMSNISPSLRDYVSSIKKQILENATYPATAQKLGLEGRVRIGLHLSSAGQIKEVGILESSGYSILDNAAADSVQSLVYPPFPEGATLKDIWIDVPIIYRRQ